MNSCAPGLALIERLKATRKWAIISIFGLTSLFVISVFVLLHVVFDCISSLFDCSELSLTSSKFKCLSLELSATKSVDWKLRFILLYT